MELAELRRQIQREIAQARAAAAERRRGGDAAQASFDTFIENVAQPLVKQALGRFAWAELAELLRLAANVDRRLKGMAYGPHWEALTDLVLAALSPARPRRTA